MKTENTTSPKVQHTAGEWIKGNLSNSHRKIVSIGNGTVAACYGKNDIEMEANAKLIAEAGTVASECGLTPRQLLEQLDELLEGLLKAQDILNSLASNSYKDSLDKTQIDNVIKKLTE